MSMLILPDGKFDIYIVKPRRLQRLEIIGELLQVDIIGSDGQSHRDYMELDKKENTGIEKMIRKVNAEGRK